MKTKKRFIFYNDWVDYIGPMGVEEKAEFLETILKYQNGEDVSPQTGFKFVRPRIKTMMDEDKIKREQKAEVARTNGKKGGRPKKTQKNPVGYLKTQKNPEKPVNVNVNVNDKVIKKKKEVLSKDNTGKPVYGNEDINLCLEIIKDANNGLMDGTVKDSRRYGKLLIGKIKKVKNVKSGQFSWGDYLKGLLGIIADNKYYVGKISSPEKIYRDLTTLQNVANRNYKDKKSSASLDIIQTI